MITVPDDTFAESQLRSIVIEQGVQPNSKSSNMWQFTKKNTEVHSIY